MARIKEEGYAYATARIRVRESKLLPLSRLERLFDITDSVDAIKLLAEAGYSGQDPDSGKEGTGDVEKLLTSELKKAYDFIEEIIPDPLVINLFRKRYDYLNAKFILKAEFLKIDAKETLSDMGTIEPARLLKLMTERKFEDVSEIFSQAILAAEEAFNKTGDPQLIDFILDNASYAEMLADAEKSEDPVLIKLINMLIDTANIRIFIRAKLLKKSEDFIRKAWIKNGSFKEENFEEIINEGLDKFFSVLKAVGYDKLAAQLNVAADKEDGISEIEKILDDFITLYLKDSKYVVMGVSPVIGYLFFKETEIKNARLIITGVKNKIPRETIKERLRLGYA
ncbi:MAG: V-type ATP synthase subunit C [Clostridiaceae bacterium]|jgi:V/A-type H+-transporting ATPase subunit C|nr:V-type ATP synthase subunit C [Clostridiaceae bacterium]